jgi:hypothetical protein
MLDEEPETAAVAAGNELISATPVPANAAATSLLPQPGKAVREMALNRVDVKTRDFFSIEI